ncbi:MAG: SusC/RagA family TonB-linked outer membrane protein [Gemmatimonadaceae bacterium]
MRQVIRRVASVSTAVAAAALAAATPLVARAQAPATLSGHVTSEAGAPLVGANVFLDGLQSGTQTDAAGRYSFVVPGARVQGQQATLTARLIGYRPSSFAVTLAPGATIAHDFVLATNPLRLGEVVVTGAGTVSAAEKLGTARSQVEAATIVRSNETNVVNALAAKAPGVLVSSSSGEPGASSYIRLRGLTTLTGSTGQPLLVIDGVPVDNSTTFTPLSGSITPGAGSNGGTLSSNRALDINPADIENVEILKGAASGAIYGSRAGQGVILITTKKGRPGQTKYALHSTASFDNAGNLPELQRKYTLGAGGKGISCKPNAGTQDCTVGAGARQSYGPELTREAYINSLITGTCDVTCATNQFKKTYGDVQTIPTYDHAGEMFREGHQLDNTLSISGGGERTTFYMSGGLLDQQGIIIGDNNKLRRYTARLNGDLQANSRLRLGGHVTFASTSATFVQSRNNVSGLLLGAWRTPPDFNNSPYLDSRTGLHRSYRYPNPGPNSQEVTRGYDNPLFVANETQATSDVGRVLGDLNAAYQFTPWLRMNYTLGSDYNNDERMEGLPWASSGSQVTDLANGSVIRGYVRNFQLDHNLTATADYHVSPSWEGSVTVGQNLNARTMRLASITGQGLITAQPFNITNTSAQLPGVDYRTTIHQAGHFVQGTADLFQQLYLTAALRNDGASTFGEANRNAWYPKASVAWNVLRPGENGNDWISSAKLRAAYGQSGTQPQPYLTNLTWTSTTFGDGYISGVSTIQNGVGGLNNLGRKPNPELKSERVSELELGTDLGIIHDRADIGLTYYRQRSTDVVFDVPVPATTGFQIQAQNAGALWNRGFEAQLNVRPVQTRDIGWDVGFNYSRNRSEVTDLQGAAFVDLGGTGGLGGVTGAAIKGQPVGVYYGSDFVRCGRGVVLADGTDVDKTCGSAKKGTLWIGPEGYPILDQINQYVIGDPNPDWQGSLHTGLRFRKLQLSALVDFVRGNDNYNGTKLALNHFGTSMESVKYRNGKYTFGKDYLPNEAVAGPGAQQAVVLGETWFENAGGVFNGPGSFAVEDGAYTKLRELSASYTFDAPVVSRYVGFSSIELRIAGRNLKTWTNYTGVDPETSILGASSSVRGVDYFNNPQSRSFVISVTANR